MRVLHINCNYIGTALHQTMARKLTELGVENRIFAPIYPGSPRVTDPDSNVTVSCCFQKWDMLTYFRKQRKIITSLEALMQPETFDCLHAHTLFTDGNVAFTLAKKYGLPYMVAVRSTDMNHFLPHMLHLRGRAREILQNASRVIFLSEGYRTALLERYLSGPLRENVMQKSAILPNGIDRFWLEHPGAARGPVEERKPLRVLFVGRIEWIKNPLLLQKAVHILAEQGREVHLTIVGAANDRALAEKLSHDALITCCPPVGKEELIRYYREADLFALPSHEETFGLVYAEAMSQGLPVVYTRGQGFDGQFPDGAVGYAASDRDARELAEKLLLCAENRPRLSVNALEGAKRFNWDTICASYVKMYEEMCV